MNTLRPPSYVPVIATLGLALAALPAWALTDAERLEKLEKTMSALMDRLENSEAENAKLRKELLANRPTPTATPASSPHPSSSAQDGSAMAVSNREFKSLDSKVKILERKLEIDREAAEATRKTAIKTEAGPNGFKIGTPDGEWQLRLRGFLQADTNTFLQDTLPKGEGIGWNPILGEDGAPNPFNSASGLGSDKFLIRRARLQFAGTLGKYTDFLIAPDFAGGQTRLYDAWTDFHYWQPLSLAVGKMKGPQDLERMQNATNLLFNERAYPSQLAANRQIGAMVHGEFAGPGFDTEYVSNISHTRELLQYQVGVFNASFDNQLVQNSDTTNFDNKEYAGRFFAHPFRHSDFEPLQRLGMGFAGNYTDWQQQSGLASLTSQGQNTILSYSTGINVPSTAYTDNTTTVGVITGTGNAQSATTAYSPKTVTTNVTTINYSATLANGSQYHFAPQAYWYYGPFGLLGDWTSSTQGLAVNESNTTISTTQADINPKTNATTGATITPGSRTTTVHTMVTAPSLVNQKSQTNHAWQIAASYVLTGEENTYWAIKPRQPFNPFAGSWGAWQLAARWTELEIDPVTFTNFGTTANPLYLYADPRSSVQHASTWGLGLNWFLNSNVRIQGNYEQTQFNGGAVTVNNTIANRPDEKVFFTRVQFWY